MSDHDQGVRDDGRPVNRSAWPLVAIAALCLGPFVVAVLLYAGRDSFGFGQLPNPDRELIADPAVVPLEPLRLADGGQTDADWARSRWSLIYARLRPCNADCAVALDRLDRVWLALGGERDRVRRILLVTDVVAAGILDDSIVPDGFMTGLLDGPGGVTLVELLGRERLDQGRYFVIDPLGNIILSYPGTADQQRLLEDLERLLEVSRVG